MKRLTQEIMTTPPSNLLLGESSDERVKAMWDLLLPMHLDVSLAAQAAGLTLVEYHKAKLGPQDYCWTGEFRFWVWDRDGYRIYVSNQKGVGFEVPADATYDEAMQALRAYMKEVQFTAPAQALG